MEVGQGPYGLRHRSSKIAEGKQCYLGRHRPVLQGCSLYTSQGEDHCYSVGRIVYLTNSVTPRYSVGDQFRSWQPFHLKILEEFPRSFGNYSASQHRLSPPVTRPS